MSETLRDPFTNTATRTNQRGQLEVSAVSESVERFANIVDGRAFTITIQQTPTGADDYFLYIKNTSDEYAYVLEGFFYRVASAETVEIYIGDDAIGTPSGGTAVTPVNLNTGSGKTTELTCEAANDITGLTGSNMAYRLILTSTESTYFNLEQDIVIAAGGVLVMKASTGAVQIDMALDIHRDPQLEKVS